VPSSTLSSPRSGPSASRRERLATVVGYELRSQLTGAPFAALLLMLLGATSTLNPVAMIPGGADDSGPLRAVANSVYALSPTFAISGFFVYPFFAAVIAGFSVLRDDEAGMTELLHSSPLTAAEYVWGKFAGVVATLFVAVLAHVLIVMLFRELSVGGVARGPYSPAAYVLAAAWFVVPGVLWSAGLAFIIGARWRAPMAVYALPVMLFVLEFVLLWNWHPPDISRALDATLMVLDPTGLRWLTHALFAQDRGIAWYNTASLAIDPVFLLGRAVTMALPLLGVAHLAHRSPRLRRRRMRDRLPIASLAPLEVSQGAPAAFRGLDDLVMPRRSPSIGRATGTVLMAELRTLVRLPSCWLFAALLVAVVTEVGGAETDAYGSTTVLTAGGIGVAALPAVTVLMCLFLLFVIVESLHRDRATGFDAISLSSPVPTGAFVAGKALAALTLVGALTVACVASGLVLLLAQPGIEGDVWPLLLIFGAVMGPTYVLWIAFVTAVMSVARSRTTALAVGFVAILLTVAQFVGGTVTWVTNWPLWGALRWTEFATFPLDGAALLLNRLTALGLSVLLFAAARRLFIRTERDATAVRVRRTPAARRALALRVSTLLALPLFTGGFLALQVQQGFEGPARQRTADAYEREHQAQWGTAVPAVIQHVDVSVNLDPMQRGLAVDGSYTMVNRTGAPMPSLPFTIPFSFGPVTWAVEGRVTGADMAHGLHVVALRRPLLPGDSVQVGFHYQATIAAGISRNGGPVDAFVLPSSVLLSTHRGDFLPVPGYVGRTAPDVQAIQNSATDDRPATSFNRGESFTAVMRVESPSELTVNGVGSRTDSLTVGNRTMVTWVTREPVSALSLVGARYAVRRAPGVAVYHLGAHARSVDVMLATLSAARAHYATWFHPYPWEELRLSEYADLNTQATSYPTNIAFSEGIGFLTTPNNAGGLAFAVTAHEAAHQWWGHLLAADTGPGTGMLVEGMADYSTLLLYETQYGADARRSFAALLERQYLDGRTRERERPLLSTAERTSADEVVLQKKGAWAMWMLHNALGPEQTFAGLRLFIAQHRTPPRLATPDAMLRALRRQAVDTVEFDAAVHRWFRSTELPEFTLQDVRCAREQNAWGCRASLRNVGTGIATVDVAALRSDAVMPSGVAPATVRAGQSVVLRWTLAERPERFLVDPDVRVLQRNREGARADVSSLADDSKRPR
jgi:ABC-2 type transport system permease protein